MNTIFVDADACPVKDEIYRVADRYQWKVVVVANMWLRVPDHARVTRMIVNEGMDRADDWIAENAGLGDVVVTADVPLADRCVKTGARVLGPAGKAFTPSSIGSDLAMRNLMTSLRDAGEIKGTGRSFSKDDRSRFLVALDTAVQAIRRTGR